MGTHIVEGDTESVRAQGGHLAKQRPGVFQQAAFGQLEHQPQVLVCAGQ